MGENIVKWVAVGFTFIILMLLILVPLLALQGYAITELWRLLIIPIGTQMFAYNVPIMSFWQAIGISAFVGYFKFKHTDAKKSETPWKDIGLMFLNPIIAIVMAHIINHFLV